MRIFEEKSIKNECTLKRLYTCLLIVFVFFTSNTWAQHWDPSTMDPEHMAVMNLVPVGQATHTATGSGNWATGGTWNTGTVPGNGSRVVIPEGITVTYNSTSSSSISWIRVDGKLRFATNQNTSLNVETIVVTPVGEYEQGTVSAPIPSSFTSIVTFLDDGPVNDPFKIARGLIIHGSGEIHGASLTSFLKTTHALSAGATSATLASVPSNWKVGDQIAITGMRMNNNPLSSQDEIRTITSIAGSTVTWSGGLTWKRQVDFSNWGLYPYIANTTRNIQFRSQNTTHERKGHVMFMHNQRGDVRYAGFYDLGRTRKDIPLSDAETQNPPQGNNVRGRYALHFHRSGGHQNGNESPAIVIGCAVVNTPGWAYVNHDSHVIFEDNVSYNAFGAHYVLENGAERGAFRRNIAMKSEGGSGRFIKTGVPEHDLAHSGNGFWFQGSNVIIEDNVASGCTDGGFTWFGRSYKATQPGQFTPAELLIHPEYAGGADGLYANDLPIMSNKNNTAYGCYHGIHLIDVEINGTGPTNSVFENFVTLNARAAAGWLLEYYRNFTVKNCKVLRDPETGFGQWSGNRAIEAFNFIDHRYPFQTRSADRVIGLIVRGYQLCINNFGGSEGDGNFEGIDMAKWQKIGGNIDHNCPDGEFKNTGTYHGVPLVSSVASEADVIPFTTMSPAPGTYPSSRSVTISSVPGASIYYVIGTPNQYPGIEPNLRTGSWTQYTGPISVTQNRMIIAIAVRNGQYSRPYKGYYYIDPNSVPDNTPPTVPTNLSSSNISSTSFTLSWSASTDSGSGVAGYDVYRNGVSIGSTSATSMSVTGLSPSTTYSMTVRARDVQNNVSAQSAPLSVTTTPPGAVDDIYEGEDFTSQSGGSVVTNFGATYFDFGGNGSFLEWNNVTVPTSGTYTLTFRYGNGSTANRQCALNVNLSGQGNIPFATNGDWGAWQTTTTSVSLQAGSNTIRLTANTASGGPNFDYMRVEGGVPGVQYTLTTSTTGQGSVSLNPPGGTYASGASVAATASAAVGWQFDGWSGASTSTSSPVNITMNGNKSLTAIFSPISSSETITIQAEDFTANSGGSVDDAQTGYTGTGYFDMAGNGSWVEYTFTAAGGAYTLAIRYANGSAGNRTCNVITNGAPVSNNFVPTGSWTTWQETTSNVTLNAGTNTVRIQVTTASGGPNVDRLILTSAGSSSARMATAIAPEQEESAVRQMLYPNPSTHKVTLTGVELPAEVHIINPVGQHIRTTISKDGTVDVSDLPKGVYMLQISNRVMRMLKE